MELLLLLLEMILLLVVLGWGVIAAVVDSVPIGCSDETVVSVGDVENCGWW